MHVSDLYHAGPVPVKRPNSLHVPVLSHETCMVHAHYALQDHAISMHEIMCMECAETCLKLACFRCSISSRVV